MNTAAAKHKHRHTPSPDRWTRVLAMVYLLVVVWVLLFKLGVQFSYMDERRVNLVPFRQVLTGQGRLDLAETLLNILIFVPLGLYAAILFRRWTLGARIVFVLLASVLLEGLQFAARIGAFDATDLINNWIGGLLGLFLFMLTEKILGKSERAQKIVNILATVATVLVIGLLVLIKLGMGPIRYQ
jgi:glycopeptide antibiotics resistance protein